MAIQETVPRLDVTRLHIYNDYDLAYEIATTIHDDMDRLIELGQTHANLSAKSPDGTFLRVDEGLKRALGLTRASASEPIMSKTLTITNAQAIEATDLEIDERMTFVNNYCHDTESWAEVVIIDKLLDDDNLWTNQQTKEFTGRTLSNWKRLSCDTKHTLLARYALMHPEVRGVRSETVIQSNAYPYEPDYKLRPAPFITKADILN